MIGSLYEIVSFMSDASSTRSRFKVLISLSGLVMVLGVVGLLVVISLANSAIERTEASWQAYVSEVQSKVSLLTRLRGEVGFGGLSRALSDYLETQDSDLEGTVEKGIRSTGKLLFAYRTLPLSQGERFAVRALDASLNEINDNFGVARHMTHRGVSPAEVQGVVNLNGGTSSMALELLREAWTSSDEQQRADLTAALKRGMVLTRSTLFVIPILVIAVGLVGWLLWRQASLMSMAEQERADARQLQSLYQDLVEGSLQGVLIHENFRLLFANDAFARMFGFKTVEEVLALESFLSLVDEPARDDLALVHGKIAAGEVRTWTGRIPCRDREDNPVWVEEMARPIAWQGIDAVQMTLMNVTDRVMHEQDVEIEREHTENQARDMVALAEELDAALTLAEEQKAKLRQLSISDFLTGVFNRRHFLECGRQEIIRLDRMPDNPISVIMMDIDHFKMINDTHGHAGGDQALIAFAKCCKQSLRDCDVFGRMGGEEFAALLPDTAQEEAVLVAERLRTATEALRVTLESGETFGFTLSLGVAEVDDPAAPFEATLNRADAALYESKKGGRNRVSVARAQETVDEPT